VDTGHDQQRKEPDPDDILRPRRIEELTNASWPTTRRGREDKVIKLGKRAVGMRWKHVIEPVK
jgi:hypothetical protein